MATYYRTEIPQIHSNVITKTCFVNVFHIDLNSNINKNLDEKWFFVKEKYHPYK